MTSFYSFGNFLCLSPLRIDNGGLALSSLRLTFLLIASWLLGPSTKHQIKAEIVSY